MSKVDQIVSEDESYIGPISVMAGRDCSLFGVLERSDSTPINLQKVISEHARLKGSSPYEQVVRIECELGALK